MARLDTAGLREAFLVETLFAEGELRLAITDLDRLVIGAAIPTTKPLTLPAAPEFGTEYFTARREVGIMNLGPAGHVRVGDTLHSLGPMDFLYIGTGHPHVTFERCGDATPSFYFLSCPAHHAFPVVRVGAEEAQSETIGDATTASRRRLNRYLHPDGAQSCQLVMGMTQLESGSVWNTMPPHTHPRRSEVYLYNGLGDDVVVHLLGEPNQTRHVIVRDREAVLSPSWSLHCGAGTKPYSFIWGMAGENQSFSDIDPVETNHLR
jgi:4-deoxy-L-threo-5-hexosulose-uronate ketol-isomerase